MRTWENSKATALAEHFIGPRAHQGEFFDQKELAKPLKVHVERVRAERARSFGDVWMGWKLWQALGLDQLCNAVLPQGRERVPWSAWSEIAAFLVLARLCEPSSELQLHWETAFRTRSPLQPARIGQPRETRCP